MVTGNTADAVWKKIIDFHNDAAGRQLSVLQDVYKSESDTNQRNQAIGASRRFPACSPSLAIAGLYDDCGKWLYHTELPALGGNPYTGGTR
jgi:glutaminase